MPPPLLRSPRRHLLLAALLPLVALHAQTPHPAYPTTGPLAQQIATLLADPAVTRAHWGIAVTTLDGKPLYGLNQGQFFHLASTAKLFTTATAIAKLPPENSIRTTASFEAPASGITQHGVSVDQTTGDSFCHAIQKVAPTAVANGEYPAASNSSNPASSYDSLRFINDLAEKIAQQGVTQIQGDIVWFDFAWPDRYPDGWAIEDMAWGYGAPVTDVVVNDNQMEMTIASQPPTQVADLRLSPDVGYYHFDRNYQVDLTPARTDIGIEMVPGSGTLKASGHLYASSDPAAEPSQKPYVLEVAIADPAAFAAQALKQKLIEHGVKVSGEARSSHYGRPTLDFLAQARRPLPPPPAKGSGFSCSGSSSGMGADSPVILTVQQTTTVSRDEDITFALKHSQNLHAERLLRALGDDLMSQINLRGIELDGDHTPPAQGARVVRQFLLHAGLDPDDFIFYDGSGLSTKDLVTPRATAKLLAYAATQPWFPQWKAALPIGGVDGTLANRFTTAPLKGHIFAKTGTLGESRALSGYLDAASGRTIVFSILVDTHAPGSSADRTTMDKIVAAIAATN